LNCSSKLHVCCDDEDDSDECDDAEDMELWRGAPDVGGGGKLGCGAVMGGPAEAEALMGGRKAADGCGNGNGRGRENAGGGTGTITLADGVAGCSRGLCRGDGP
jgi:hypothetical protein